MKALFYTTFLSSLIIFFGSCKSSQSNEYKQFYNTMNTTYNSAFIADDNKGKGGDEKPKVKKLTPEEMRDQKYMDYLDSIAEGLKGINESIKNGNEKSGQVSSATGAPEMGLPYEPDYQDQNAVEDQQQPYASEPEYDPREALEALGMDGDVRHEQQSVEVVDAEDYSKLKKYSVIVATLSQHDGVEALKRFFDRDGIHYFVARGPSSLYYFVVHSDNSEEEALKARANFLIQHTVNKSRADIWEKYYIPLIDTFILEKK